MPAHDDLADAMSRVFDIDGMSWPRQADEEGPRTDRYAKKSRSTSWMAR
jgi:hypothetical protein